MPYEFQTVGEFILAESQNNDWQVQVRQQPWRNSNVVSVNTAMATVVDGQEVGIYVGQAEPLVIDGVPTAITNGGSLTIGNSQILRSGNLYTIAYAGDDGIITDEDELVLVRVNGDHLNLQVCPSIENEGLVQGLLGNSNNNRADDFALRDGTVLDSTLSFEQIYGDYADGWRINQEESLFIYEDGENTNTFTDLNFPRQPFTVDSLDPLVRAAAEQLVREAGIPEGAAFDAAVLDFAITNDETFIIGAVEAVDGFGTVQIENVAPIATDDSYDLDEDTILTINFPGVLSNDNDLDDDSLVAIVEANPINGTLELNSDGSFEYTPNANFNGTDSFTYTLSDGNGGEDTAIVDLTINPINDNPVAGDDTVSTQEDTPLTIAAADLLTNDSDLDGDTLTITSVNNAANGTVELDGTDITFTPDANFSGLASFNYTISDGNDGEDTASVAVNVESVNDPPQYLGAIPYLSQADSPFDLSGLGTTFFLEDFEDEVLDVPGVIASSTFELKIDGNEIFADSVDGDDGEIDGFGRAGYALAPANNDIGSSASGITFTFDPNELGGLPTEAGLVWTDGTPNDTIIFQAFDESGNVIGSGIEAPNIGDTRFDGTTEEDRFFGIVNESGISAISIRGTIPNANAFEVDHLQYGRFTLINPTNNPPLAGDDTVSTPEDTPLTIAAADLLTNDSDVDGDPLTITSVDNAVNGTVALDGTEITFTADANFNGLASFNYTISDGNGGEDTASVAVNVESVNDNPLAGDDTVSTDEDTPLTIAAADLLINDIDVDGDSLTITNVNDAANGTVELDGTNITFTPDANFSGLTSFNYTISDGNGGEDTATVSVTVTPDDSEPNIINGTPGRNILQGTDGINIITGGFGTDRITGNAGDDVFVYNNLRDAGDIITDFTLGEDKFDLSNLISSLDISFAQIGFADISQGTAITLDADSSGVFRNYILVQGEGVNASTLDNPDNFVDLDFL